MSGLVKRREADIQRLRALAAASRGQLELVGGTVGNTAAPIELIVRLPTAGNARYPQQVQHETRLQISLPARYPFEAPTARIVGTPIFHPNVFESGVVCVGSKWLASEGLDLYVTRIVRLLCFDGMLVNLNSIAHAAAGRWYAQARRQHPASFPTAVPDWTPANDKALTGNETRPVEKVVRACPQCGGKLRLPSGRSGAVQCPRCQHEFEVNT